MLQYGSNYMEQVKLEHRMDRITAGHISIIDVFSGSVDCCVCSLRASCSAYPCHVEVVGAKVFRPS